jgi:hypothetical protein
MQQHVTVSLPLVKHRVALSRCHWLELMCAILAFNDAFSL